MKIRASNLLIFRTQFAAASCLLVILFVVPVRGQNRHEGINDLRQFSKSLQELSSRIAPSVVQIIGTGYGLDDDSQHIGVSVLSKQRSTGSGAIVSADGYIMTNAHVISSARTIRVKVNHWQGDQSRTFDAKLVGLDRELDLALLKIDATGLKPLPFANSLELKQGELVLAFGSPLGMEDSVTMGIVSSAARELNEDDTRIFIQTDAPINPGNSGGPLIDTDGRIVGINTFILSQSGGSEGIGFAVPSNVVRYVYASVMKDGHVHRGQIGISGRTVTAPLATAFNIEPENGVLVEDVEQDSPAAQSGIQVGDVVLSIDGITLHNVRDFALQAYQYAIGDAVQLEILRNGEKLKISTTLSESPDDPQRFADMVTPGDNLISQLGILGITVDDNIRKLVSLRIANGVVVAALAGPSPYFGALPQEGDVIHAVNGHEVGNVVDLRTALGALKLDDPVVLQVERQGNLMFLVLESD